MENYKKLLIALLIGGIFGTYYVSRREHGTTGIQLEERVLQPSSKLAQIPDFIQGAASVQKYEVEGSKYCLVHIKLLHDTSLFQVDEEVKSYILNVENDIYDILNYLISLGHVYPVYGEGTTTGEWGVWKEYAAKGINFDEDLRNTLSEARQVLEDPNLKGNKESIQKTYDKLRAVYEDMRSDPVYRLLTEGKVELRVAESDDLGELIERMRKDLNEGKLDLDQYKRETEDKREDQLIRFIVDNNDKVAVVVFGGGHNWKDNIDRWNKTNPNKKFSLVEITPNSYQKYRDFLGVLTK